MEKFQGSVASLPDGDRLAWPKVDACAFGDFIFFVLKGNDSGACHQVNELVSVVKRLGSEALARAEPTQPADDIVRAAKILVNDLRDVALRFSELNPQALAGVDIGCRHDLDTYLGNVEQNDSRKLYRASQPTKQIQNPKSEARKRPRGPKQTAANKPKTEENPKHRIQIEVV
jgi:hypothetical protein